MSKRKVMIAQFPGNNQTHPDVSDYVADLLLKMTADPRIGPGNVGLWKISDTPITMSRNRCLEVAKATNSDYVLMIDSDMRPDVIPAKDDPLLPAGLRPGIPFWDVAWPFALEHKGPCVIAAPYCGPPPQEAVYVFDWEQSEGGSKNPNFKLVNVTRTDAAGRTGVQRAAALATGLMLIDMRGVEKLPHPRFYYEYTDKTHTAKASTEDVTFSRDMDAVGVPLYCAWDSWAGHWKLKLVVRPERMWPHLVPQMMAERADEMAHEKMTGADLGKIGIENDRHSPSAGKKPIEYAVPFADQVSPSATTIKPTARTHVDSTDVLWMAGLRTYASTCGPITVGSTAGVSAAQENDIFLWRPGAIRGGLVGVDKNGSTHEAASTGSDNAK